MLLHRVEDTKFKDGYNRYSNSKHYHDYHAPTIIEKDKEQEEPKRDKFDHQAKWLLNGLKIQINALADEKVRAVYLGRGKFHKSGKIETAEGGMKKNA